MNGMGAGETEAGCGAGITKAPVDASASPAPIPLTHNVSSHLHHLYPTHKKEKWHAESTGIPINIQGRIILISS